GSFMMNKASALNGKSRFVPAIATAGLLCLTVGCGKSPAPEGNVALAGATASMPAPAPETIKPAPAIVADAAVPKAEPPIAAEAVAGSAEVKRTLEEQIHMISKSERTPQEKAKELFAMFPQLDPAGQRKV